MAAAFAASGCLVTSVPDDETPTLTPPFILDGTAAPPVSDILEIKKDPTNPNKYTSVGLSVSVRSEDAGADLVPILYVDYGFYDEDQNLPFRAARLLDNLPAKTLSDGPRSLAVAYRPTALLPGCHTVTLMVTHAFSPNLCPKDTVGDSDQITWRFALCADSSSCIADVDLSQCQFSSEPKYCDDIVSGGAQ